MRRTRLLRLCLSAVLVAAGAALYRGTLQPDPTRLETFAEEALTQIFGRGVSHGAVRADVLRGVEVYDLVVPSRDGTGPGLSAHGVLVRHDVVALFAGVLRLRRIEIREPLVRTHETEGGDLALDVPFSLPRSGPGGASLPRIVVTGGAATHRAGPVSRWFAPDAVVSLSGLELSSVPEKDGRLLVLGGFDLPELGRGGGPAHVAVRGIAWPEEGRITLRADWGEVVLSRALRDRLAPDLVARLDGLGVLEGPHRLSVTVDRDPFVEAGRMRVHPQAQLQIRPDGEQLPLLSALDDDARARIASTLGPVEVAIETDEAGLVVRHLSAAFAGGELTAHGRVEEGGDAYEAEATIRGLRLDDPALRRALGPLATTIDEEFILSGVADASVRVRKASGAAATWEADLVLRDTRIAYLGRFDPVKRTPSGARLRDGFPYAIEHATGRIRLSPGRAELEGIEGTHGGARVRLLGAGERGRDGSPTGTVTWDDAGARVRLTVEARGVAVDADLHAAVEGSEFAGFLERYRLGGVISRATVDILRDPDFDAVAVVELDLELAGTTFSYAQFPLPVSSMDGVLSLRRPRRPGAAERGNVLLVTGSGKAAGGDLRFEVNLVRHEDRGRVVVEGRGLALDGDLAAAVFASEEGAGGLGDAWRYLRPTGRADALVDLPVLGDPGPRSYRIALAGAGFHLGAGREDRFVDLLGLRGDVKVLDDRIEVGPLAGTLGDGSLRVEGTIVGGTRGAWDLRVHGDHVEVSDAVLGLVRAETGGETGVPRGVTIEPGGRATVDVSLRRAASGRDEGLRVGVRATDADLAVRLGALRLRVEGGFEVDGEVVALRGLRVSGDGFLLVAEDARLGPAGLRGAVDVRLADLVPTPEFLSLLPESIRGGVADATRGRRLRSQDLRAEASPTDDLLLSGRLEFLPIPGAPPGPAPIGAVEFRPVTLSAPDARGARTVSGLVLLRGLGLQAGSDVEDVNGEVEIVALALGDEPAGEAVVRIASARVAGLRVEGLSTRARLREGVLEAPSIVGSVYGGRLDAAMRLAVRDPGGYAGRARVSGARLEFLVADLGGGDLRGGADLDATFESPGGTLGGLVARGHVRVRGGDLGSLPPIATIPALLTSILPGARGQHFDRADVDFDVRDQTVFARRIVLGAPLFEMDGHGTIGFDRRLDVTLSPQFIKSFLLPGVLQIPLIGDVLGLLREDPFYVLRIEGDLRTAQPRVVPLPFLSPRRATRSR